MLQETFFFFMSCWLAHNQLSGNYVLLFSCYPIGPLCLSGLGYSSHTVTHKKLFWICEKHLKNAALISVYNIPNNLLCTLPLNEKFRLMLSITNYKHNTYPYCITIKVCIKWNVLHLSSTAIPFSVLQLHYQEKIKLQSATALYNV